MLVHNLYIKLNVYFGRDLSFRKNRGWLRLAISLSNWYISVYTFAKTVYICPIYFGLWGAHSHRTEEENTKNQALLRVSLHHVQKPSKAAIWGKNFNLKDKTMVVICIFS